MAEIIRRREPVNFVEYYRNFDYEGENDWGYSFPCDKNGELLNKNDLVVMANFKKCLTGEINGRKIEDKGIRERHYTYFEPMQIRCHCKRIVTIEDDTKCECGQWYNCFGQELRDDWMNNPSVWDEEVGDLY